MDELWSFVNKKNVERRGVSQLFLQFYRPHRSLSKNPDKTRMPRAPALCAGITDKVTGKA
jgi:hypothetical protein